MPKIDSSMIMHFASTAENTTTIPWWQIALGAISAAGAIGNSFAGGGKKKRRDARLIKSSVTSALWRLANIPRCKNYIQAEFGINPERVLTDVYANGQITRKSLDGAVAQAPAGSGSRGWIDLDDDWFDDPTVGGYVGEGGSLNRSNMRTLAILHELMHLVGARHNGPLLRSMGAPDRSNTGFNDGLLTNCFGLNHPPTAKPPVWPLL